MQHPCSVQGVKDGWEYEYEIAKIKKGSIMQTFAQKRGDAAASYAAARIDCCVDLQLRADGWTDYGL